MENEDFILVASCMFSGKSKYLIDNYYGKDVEAYKPDIDTRDGNVIKSRAYDDKVIPCKRVSVLKDISPKKSTIIIDEAQFFAPKDLKDFVIKCKKEHKKLVVAGLDLLASGKEWETYTEIKKMCDKEIKLTAKCNVCGKPATFTQMVSGDKTKAIQIEGNNIKYEARCLQHFTK